jgi:hypothetical protein
MSQPYLEVTYRRGKPFAAYLYFNRRAGDKADRTETHGDYVVDYAADGRAIGVEFLRTDSVDLASLNRIVTAANQAALFQADLVPLKAA